LIELDEIMRRHHAGVGRLELPRNPLLLTPREDPIHAVGDHEERTVVHLRHEVAKRDADRTRQPHGPAITSDRGEVTVRLCERIAVAAPSPLGNLRVRRAGQA
jgi:hypothetical protein